MAQPHDLFDRNLVVTRRQRAAANARNHTFLVERVATDFSDRLQGIKRNFKTGINLGAYTGELSRTLRPLENIGTLIDVEPAPALLAQCAEPKIMADEDALPFGTHTLDLVVSALAFQLTNDLPGAFIQIRKALKPDGLFLAAMLGGESLHELRHAWLVAEENLRGGASPRVAPFADMRDIGALLQRAGFALPVVDTDLVAVTYDSPLTLMQEIRAMAGANPLSARSRQPVTRRLLERVCETYTDLFSTPDGRVTATFEIVTMTAWAPHESQQKALKPGSATTPLADVLGVKEQSAGDKAR